MAALAAQNPKTITINASSYRWSLSVQSGINSTGQFVVGGVITYQRCQFSEDGTCIDDPSPGSCTSYPFANLNDFMAANPSLAPSIQSCWNDLGALVDAINAQNKLV